MCGKESESVLQTLIGSESDDVTDGRARLSHNEASMTRVSCDVSGVCHSGLASNCFTAAPTVPNIYHVSFMENAVELQRRIQHFGQDSATPEKKYPRCVSASRVVKHF